MGFNNPAMPWRELERRLSDRELESVNSSSRGSDENDSQIWPLRRVSFTSHGVRRFKAAIPYAELHTHSHFSFLDGASSPEELVLEAERLGLEALALTDHGGFYGVVRFAEAAREIGLPTVFGAELTVDAWKPEENSTLDVNPRDPSRVGTTDPPGKRLVVLARHPDGYASLAALLSRSQMAGKKGAPRLPMSELISAVNRHRGDWALLTSGRRGAVPTALQTEGISGARRELCRLIEAAGNDNVFVELWHHGDPSDDARNDRLADLALEQKVGLLCTNGVHYATPSRRHLAWAMSAIRSRRSLD